ncbi:hypothetical protein NQ318_017643 [Aromia moschata]|uniref:Ig-like domain-containing protein n=1 Tax=Aromia moschata TaxID=1265417 RepID=A0AAV8Z3B7_9CUCU|nr:hypothetical protein NQ318_017643 [Aromia moschata]
MPIHRVDSRNLNISKRKIWTCLKKSGRAVAPPLADKLSRPPEALVSLPAHPAVRSDVSPVFSGFINKWDLLRHALRDSAPQLHSAADDGAVSCRRQRRPYPLPTRHFLRLMCKLPPGWRCDDCKATDLHNRIYNARLNFNMAHLTVTQRIEILIFIGCGNKTRTQQEVCNLFNAKYPDNPITQSTVNAPRCTKGYESMRVGALPYETIVVQCHVDAVPEVTRFSWTYNTSKGVLPVQGAKTQNKGNVSLLHFTPDTDDVESVSCWASNGVGRQEVPCVFRIVPADYGSSTEPP